MKKNLGTVDRLIRLLLGIVLGVAALFVSGVFAKVILLILGLFCIYEAVAGWCALYALLGKSTCPIE